MPLRTAQSAAACTDWNIAGLLLNTPIMCGRAAARQLQQARSSKVSRPRLVEGPTQQQRSWVLQAHKQRLPHDKNGHTASCSVQPRTLYPSTLLVRPCTRHKCRQEFPSPT
eukprot:GHRQ01011020.1.p5 GENE.GHRQ01011020.1~~GHRQ01011020.1.p5  ORF type:complete len:111 (+),score=26.93 GHRQ01011020.1:338-670(+)